MLKLAAILGIAIFIWQAMRPGMDWPAALGITLFVTWPFFALGLGLRFIKDVVQIIKHLR